MLKKLFALGVGALLSLSLFGCSSTTYSQNVSRIQKGFDKTQVLELLGSPNKSDYSRQNEQHVWTYFYMDKSNKRVLKVWWEGERVARTQNFNASLRNLERSEDYSEYERRVKESRNSSFENL